MDLGKINRDAEDRSVARAAGVTALMGLNALLLSAASSLEGQVLESRIGVLLAIGFFALAYAVYRGSRAAAVAVVVIFLLMTAINFLASGITLGRLVWTLILGGILWAGMRGVFAQAARPARPGPRSRRPA